jgi:hypothetical protein
MPGCSQGEPVAAPTPTEIVPNLERARMLRERCSPSTVQLSGESERCSAEAYSGVAAARPQIAAS